MRTILNSRRHHYVARASVFLIIVALIAGMAGCSCGGTISQDLEIWTWENLNEIRNNLGGHHTLMTNLDSSTIGYTALASRTANEGNGWEPIGTLTNPFEGIFDGQGFEISDLFIYRPDEDEVGLFGRVSEGGLIKNVGLVSVNVTGKKSVGALVGYNRKGTLYSDVGPPYSKTYSYGSVTGEEDVGGLVGNNYDGIVNQCESSADVFHVSCAPDEECWRTGGLVGLNSGTVLNCNYNGAVNGDCQVGGLVGLNEALFPTQVGLVEDCGGVYSVHGNYKVGGVAGQNVGDIRRASFEGVVNGTYEIVIYGALNEGATGNAHSSDTALPGSYVGGVVGWNGGNVEDCSAEVTVEGYQYVGGLAGANNGTVEDCSSDSKVTGTSNVGGLLGANWGNVDSCSSSGDVTGKDYVGGLVGYNAEGGTWSNSASSSYVTCDSNCGPLIGRDESVRYNLRVSSTSGGSVTSPGEGTFAYNEGEVINLVATPDAGYPGLPGYQFIEWTGDVGTIANINAASTTITMNGSYNITANFEEIPEQPSELVIGMARDTDESLAIFEQVAAGPVMREFVEQVNAAGGVHLSAYDTATEDCYVPLEIDRREINVATWDIGDVTAEICADIANGDVHFLFGGPYTDSIFTQAPIANAAHVVLLTFEGGASYIANDPEKLAKWPYVFNTLSYSDWYQLPVLSAMLEAELGRPPKAYVVHIEGQHGDEYLAVAEDNFDVLGDVEVPFDPAELDAEEVVLGAMAALGDPANPNYDLFCCFAYPDHVLGITALSQVHGFNSPAMIFGPGANFGFYPYLYGDPPDPSLVDGILSFTAAAYDANAKIQAVYDLIAERMDDDEGDPISGLPGFPGILSLDYWGTPCYWAGLEMWLEAVEEVGYVDQELLRDALAAFEDDPADTVLGDCWFRMYGAPGEGGGNLDYLCHTGEIGQWQSGGVFETVGYEGITDDLPNYVVTADLMFPMTDNWGWLP